MAHLFLAGMLLHEAEGLADTLANAERLTFEEVRDWLVEWTGSDDLIGLGADYEALLTRTFRADSLSANRYLNVK